MGRGVMSPVWVFRMVIKGKGLGGAAICILIILWRLETGFFLSNSYGYQTMGVRSVFGAIGACQAGSRGSGHGRSTCLGNYTGRYSGVQGNPLNGLKSRLNGVPGGSREIVPRTLLRDLRVHQAGSEEDS